MLAWTCSYLFSAQGRKSMFVLKLILNMSVWVWRKMFLNGNQCDVLAIDGRQLLCQQFFCSGPWR